MEIPRGVSKANNFKGKYEAKLEIPGGRGREGGSNQKTFHGGGTLYGYIIWNHTILVRQMALSSVLDGA